MKNNIWIAPDDDRIINLSNVCQITIESIDNLIRLLAWYDNDPRHCIVIDTFCADMRYEVSDGAELVELPGSRCAYIALNNIKCLVNCRYITDAVTVYD